MNFLIGAVSGVIANFITTPFDFIKVQIQLKSELGVRVSALEVAKEAYLKERTFKVFYQGIDSATIKQIIYTSIRVGTFYQITDFAEHHGKKTLLVTFASSLFAGGLAAFASNPFDMALVRKQSDHTLPDDLKRNYKGSIDAVKRIISEEGASTLWRGSYPNIVRCMIVNFSMLTPFEETKRILRPYVIHEYSRVAYASLVAGLCISVLALPFDNIKNKLQRMSLSNNSKHPETIYKGVFDCFYRTVKHEGASRLWVGFSAFYLRVAPFTIISLMISDTLRKHMLNKFI